MPTCHCREYSDDFQAFPSVLNAHVREHRAYLPADGVLEYRIVPSSG